MSERFTVALVRMLSQALGPNPLDAVCPEMPAHDAGRLHILRLIKAAPRAAHKLSAA
jgi:hypothetical protein